MNTSHEKSNSSSSGGHLWKGNSSIDFSFPRPNDENILEEDDTSSFTSNKSSNQHDPTSKLIGKFLEQQKASGEMSLDMDMEMEELRRQQQHDHDQNITRSSLVHRQVLHGVRPPLPPNEIIQSPDRTGNKTPVTTNNMLYTPTDSSKEPRVSFHESLTSELIRRPSSMYSNVEDDSSSCDSSLLGDDDHKGQNSHSEEILRSNSYRTNTNASSRRLPSIALSKTKSRLMDPPSTPYDQRSGAIHQKSGQLNFRSGFLGNPSIFDDDDDDPFFDDDFSEDHVKGTKVSTMMVIEWFVIETLSSPPLFEMQQVQEEEDQTMAEVQSLQRAGINVPVELRSSVFPRTKSNRSHTPTAVPSENGKNNNNVGQAPNKSPIGQSRRFYSSPISKKYDENTGISIDKLHRLNQKNVSAWNMKRLMRIIRHGALTTLDEQIVDTINHDDDSATHIRSEVEAKAAARKIFRSVAKPRSRYIYLDDIMRFMREDEALKTMSLFEGAIETERISKKALKNWLVKAFRDRRSLALTLNDTKSAVNKLNVMVNVIVSIIIVIIGVTSLNIITSQSLLFLSSQVVVVAFVFGNTCKNVFESIIFLFVIHPYDVGDRCEIDGVQMVVEEINILTTVFLKYDNQKIFFPNYILNTKPIYNFYRSPDMGDAIELCFHVATPGEKIALMRQRITSYIESKKEHWYPSPMIILKDVEGLHMLKIAIWLQHRMNHQDMGERWERRALLVEECVKILREMDIEFRIYPLNVNVSSLPPLTYAHVPPSTWNIPPPEGSKQIVHP
ncbi:unnamed protein product [Amaranthus hypochondriacus]